jgi:hypothetical protein
MTSNGLQKFDKKMQQYFTAQLKIGFQDDILIIFIDFMDAIN